MSSSDLNNTQIDENEFFDWDDEISCDDEFTLLPEGEYDFTVKSFERGRSKKGAPMAIVNLEIQSNFGKTIITDNIVLMKKLEWKISSFFRSVGLKKHGEKVNMRWLDSIGCSGRCRVIQDEYEDSKGNKRKNNKISRYYDNPNLADERLEEEINVEPTPW